MGGGAWPFLVSGVICLVDSDNERDFILLNRLLDTSSFLLRGTMGNTYRKEVGGRRPLGGRVTS